MRYDEMIREIKNERIAAAIAVAAELYLRYGISDAKMTDIAEQAQIGVASLYRYFGTKQLFTVKVGAYIWKTTMKKLEPIYKNEAYLHMSGIEQVTVLLNMYWTAKQGTCGMEQFITTKSQSNRFTREFRLTHPFLR